MLFALSTDEMTTYGTYAAAGVLGLLGLLVTWALVRGLFGARSLLRRELTAYFLSPIAYVVFVILAYVRRRDAQAHKRLMVLAALSIISAAVIRWPIGAMFMPSPVPGYAVYDLASIAFLLPLVAWDLATLRRLHPVTLMGGLLLVVMAPLIVFVSQTGWWYAFGDWIIAS